MALPSNPLGCVATFVGFAAGGITAIVTSNPLKAFGIGIAVGGALDAVARIAMAKESLDCLRPDKGAHIAFVPVWLSAAVLVGILTYATQAATKEADKAAFTFLLFACVPIVALSVVSVVVTGARLAGRGNRALEEALNEVNLAPPEQCPHCEASKDELKRIAADAFVCGACARSVDAVAPSPMAS